LGSVISLTPPSRRLGARPSEAVFEIGKLTKGKSDDTTCASGPRATELRVIHNRAFRSGQSDCATCAPHDAICEYNEPHMSDQLRHAGNELPEFLPSDRCPNSGRSSEYRRLQPQLLYSAACMQTAVLKRPPAARPTASSSKNPDAPAVKREAEEDWPRRRT
jgi:hypothetical protein